MFLKKSKKVSIIILYFVLNGLITSNKAVLSGNEDEGIRIKSPIIGTAYLAPEPGAKKFIELGQKIKRKPIREPLRKPREACLRSESTA